MLKNTARSRRPRAAATASLAAAAVLGLALAGCGQDSTSPQEARGRADTRVQAKAARTAGTVDCARAKCIALTFDAGPGPHTPQLLDILKEKKVHATFFLLGSKHVDTYPDIVRRAAAEGHEIANHTWTHRRLDQLKPDEIRSELGRTQRAVEALTGRAPTLMRPPQGRTNDEVTAVSKELGLSQVLWSATAKDYATTDSALIHKRILDQASRDGIILLHDIYDGTVPAVPGIIDELTERGYTFVTVPQLLAPGTPQPGTLYRP
ncbi:Peptidoglycan-N-acetylglucosamine deacetylase [Streptomyces hundungensis]|uniref:Peptidoglycan-N-acetylglucosamine deacetylase n=1 Tax=Streptomyces hundungensis TaxID=1077946 RepID=A0A387H7F9_9ACTN|nr:polysaccharide deacetylase family protein [Streptomyces hundungensis]AYG79279.1 Peptidoglycan-N-acetylglucosamine deacetylase [Streptomyces hundungensis]